MVVDAAVLEICQASSHGYEFVSRQGRHVIKRYSKVLILMLHVHETNTIHVPAPSRAAALFSFCLCFFAALTGLFCTATLWITSWYCRFSSAVTVSPS